MNDNDKDKKKIKIYYSLLVTVLCIIGVSYAFFTLALRQTDNNTVASRTCFNTTLTEETERVVLENAYPIVDSEGLKGTPFTFKLKNNCSSYIRIYITIDSEHRGNLGTTYLDDNYIKVNISPKGTTSGQSIVLGSKKLTELDNNRKGYIIINTGLQANEEKSYDLRIWMDENVTLDQGLGKSWEGKIVVIGEASNSQTLTETILADNEVVEPLTTPGQEVSAHTLNDILNMGTLEISTTSQKYYFVYGTGYEANGTQFNLTGVSSTNDTYDNSYNDLIGKYMPQKAQYDSSTDSADSIETENLDYIFYIESATATGLTYKLLGSNKNKTEALLASTKDDYGTSYYFRGVVKNNYVQFANKCWRIVRITGDGSVKLVLHNDNTSNMADPCSSSNNNSDAAFAGYSGTLYKVRFSYYGGDNAYIGFMYGATGSSDYANTHANTNKSEILKQLESWYEENLISYGDKIADTIWCNDKSTIKDTNFNPYNFSTSPTGLGYYKNLTYYGAVKRVLSYDKSTTLSAPSLICSNDDNGGNLSKFTVNDTIKGNGALEYKIGLLTIDEALFSGYSYGKANETVYLSENASDADKYYYTLSPAVVNSSGAAGIFIIAKNSLGYRTSNTLQYLRPAIALTSDTIISGGSGTSEDPYVVK